MDDGSCPAVSDDAPVTVENVEQGFRFQDNATGVIDARTDNGRIELRGVAAAVSADTPSGTGNTAAA